MRKKVSAIIDYPNIKALFLSGLTRREVSAKLEIDYYVVCKVLRKYGLADTRSSNNKPKRNLDFYSDDYTG